MQYPCVCLKVLLFKNSKLSFSSLKLLIWWFSSGIPRKTFILQSTQNLWSKKSEKNLPKLINVTNGSIIFSKQVFICLVLCDCGIFFYFFFAFLKKIIVEGARTIPWSLLILIKQTDLLWIFYFRLFCSLFWLHFHSALSNKKYRVEEKKCRNDNLYLLGLVCYVLTIW